MKRGLASGLLTTLALVAVPTAARAADPTPPYNDLNGQGSIGLCDALGHAVTSGSIYDKPFVWRAVSSVPPVAPYDRKGRTAVLVAYQPRSTAYPDQWNGDTLTAGTVYSDLKHPTAVATALDFTLQDFLHEYPLRWDGWVQLRMFFGAPGTSTFTANYPTADIHVSGTTWTLVRGGGVPCSTSPAVSSEVGMAHLNVSPTAVPTNLNGGSTSQNRAAGAGAGSSANGSSAGVPTPSTTGGQAAPDLSANTASSGGGPGKGWLVALAVVVAGAVGLLILRRRRPAN